MKLIAEYCDHDLSLVKESKANGEKSYQIEGVFAQANKPNRNGRNYAMEVMKPAVDKYFKEQVKTGRAVGELNHPDGPTVNLDKVSHRITDLRFEGNNVMGKALILDTPMGKVVKGLLDGGVQLGVSTRGMGSLEKRNGVMEVKNDYHLNTVDSVQDPSAPDAFVNGIMEGVEWVWNNGLIQSQDIEKIETEIKRTPSRALAEAKVREFENFLSLLK
jgi:hypothetical protein